jgi:hypothetical protein
MATSSTADEPRTRADEWHEPEPDQSLAESPPATAPESRPVVSRVRDELWQPRYAIVAAIVLVLIALQIWILF